MIRKQCDKKTECIRLKQGYNTITGKSIPSSRQKHKKKRDVLKTIQTEKQIPWRLSKKVSYAKLDDEEVEVEYVEEKVFFFQHNFV